MNTTATITEAQAWAMANVLNNASMDVTVTSHAGRPAFKGATGAQLIAAAMVVAAAGGRLAETMPTPEEWLMVTFEDGGSIGLAHWSSLELGWTK